MPASTRAPPPSSGSGSWRTRRRKRREEVMKRAKTMEKKARLLMEQLGKRRREKKRRKRKVPKSSSSRSSRPAAGTRKSGHYFLRAFVPGSPWPVSGCRLRFLGSTVDTCTYVSWRLSHDSRLFHVTVSSDPGTILVPVWRFGGAGGVQEILISVSTACVSLSAAFGLYSTHFLREGGLREMTSGKFFVFKVLLGSTADTCAASVYGGFEEVHTFSTCR